MKHSSNNFKISFSKDTFILPSLNNSKNTYDYALVSVVNYGQQGKGVEVDHYYECKYSIVFHLSVNSREEVNSNIFQNN